MGGANRGGGVYWNFLHNATVTAGNRTLVKDGSLQSGHSGNGYMIQPTASATNRKETKTNTP